MELSLCSGHELNTDIPSAILQDLEFSALPDGYIEGNVWRIKSRPQNDVLRQMSVFVPGVLFGNAYGYTHQVGSSSIYYMVEEEIENALASRERVRAITGDSRTGFTFTNQARHLHTYIHDRQGIYSQPHQSIIRECLATYHYQRCIPHIRAAADQPYPIPYMAIYDLRRAYHSMLMRMPSPFASIFPNGKIRWSKATPEILKRWETVKNYLDKDAPRPLRLAFCGVGVAPACREFCKGYHRGEEIRFRIEDISPLMGVCALAVRCVFEVVQKQAALLNSRYANIDSVSSEDPFKVPEYWEELGLEYAIKQEGRCELITVGKYRFLNTVTGELSQTDNLPERLPTRRDALKIDGATWDGANYHHFLTNFDNRKE